MRRFRSRPGARGLSATVAFVLAWFQCVPSASFLVFAADTTTLSASADTYLRKGAPNKNQGTEAILRLRDAGDNRALVQFTQSAIAAAVESGQLVSATLQLTISRNGNNWGPTGRTIDVHRMTKAWTELGATWNCAVDANTGNSKADCSGITAWKMEPPGPLPFAAAPTATALIKNRQSGSVSFDVTADVAAFLAGTQPNQGWVLKKTSETQTGLVEFAARQTANPPRLLLVVQQGDLEPPTISNLTPADGSTVDQARPTISADFADTGGSGVNPASARLTIDGTDVTAQAQVSATSISFTPAADLADGPHTALFNVADNANNPASAQTAFTVDTVVEPPVTPQSGFIHGTVFHAVTEAPLADAVITVQGITGEVRSNASGEFQYPTPGSGEFVVDVTKNGFTLVQRPVTVLETRDVAVAPTYLTPIDSQVTLITAAQGGVATDSTEFFELTFPPGAAPHDLPVTITRLDDERQLPGAMASVDQGHIAAVYFEPRFTTFNAPATLRARNTMGLPPGTQVNLQQWHDGAQEWEPREPGVVTADGQWIEFSIIRFFCWYCFWLKRILPDTANKPQQPAPTTPQSSDPSKGCEVHDQSDVCVASGTLSESHSLPGLRTLGIDRTLTFTYRSSTASPSVLLGTDYVLTPTGGSPTLIPATTSAAIQIEGRLITASFEGASGPLRQAVLWDGKNARGELVPTGAYPYTVTLSNDYDATLGGTAIPAMDRSALATNVESRAVVINERASPFGAGWGLEGLQRLSPQPDGTILVTDGSASATVFRPGPQADIATVGSILDDVLMLSGHGDGTFQPVQRFILGITDPPVPSNNPSWMASGDFNEDGLQDVAVTLSRTGEVALLFSQGRTTFTAPQRIAVEPALVRVGVADFNRDGHDDLVVVSQTANTVAVLLGNGDGTFQPKRMTATGNAPSALAVGDLTNDGILDLVVANAGSVNEGPQTAAVLLGVGDGTFQPAPSPVIGRTPTAVVLGDVNADTVPDLVVANRIDFALSLLLGVGDGTFQPAQPISLGGRPDALAIRDVNGDSRPDLAVADDRNIVTVLLVTGPAAFQRLADLPVGQGPSALDAGDLNQDGFQDLAVTNSGAGSVSVLLGNGDGTFQGQREIPVGFNTVGIVIGEFDDRLGDPDQVFSGLPGDFSQVRKHADGTYTHQLTDGTQLTFDARGLHERTIDRNGNETRYTYDTQDRLIRVEMPGAAAFDLSYDPGNGRLASISDSDGRTTQVLGDGAGDLRRITNPDGTTRNFIYDAEHRLVSQTNQRGNTTDYVYDAFGRIAEAVLPERPIFDPSTGIVTSRREVRRFTPADTQGLINTLPAGVGTPDNPAAPVQPPLSVFQDGSGNVTQVATDAFGAPTKIIDPVGHTTIIERDVNSQAARITQPDGTQFTMLHDSRGNLTLQVHRRIDPRFPTSFSPVVTKFTYDPRFNQLTKIIDPRRDSPLDPLAACINGCTTTIEHDARGNPTRITDQLSQATEMTYDARGLLLTLTDPLGTATPAPGDHQVSFTYDPVIGNLLTATDPIGRATTLTYDAAGNVRTSRDAALHTTTFTYDELNRLTDVLDAANGTTHYEYDPAGNLTLVRDANTNETQFAYDALNLLSSTTNSVAQTKQFFYDAARDLAQVRDAKNQTITFGYDAAHQLVQKTLKDALGAVQDAVTYGYDVLGNLALVQDSDSKLAFTYDSASEVVENIVGDPANPALAQVPETFTYSYDFAGNRQSMGCSKCLSVAYTYDGLNRPLGVNSPNLVSRGFEYDALGRLTRLFSGPVSIYAYDDASQLLSINTTNLGNPLEAFAYTYDPTGNRNTLTDRFGLHDYGYDVLNRLTGATHPATFPFPAETYDYDAVGNRTSSHLSALHVHNTANRLLEDTQFTYTYDANGNRITRQDKTTSELTTYTYDIENQLVQVDLPIGQVVRFRYDGLGRRIEKDVNGTLRRFNYDQEDLVTILDGAGCATHIFLHGPGIDQPLAFMQDTNNNCSPFSDAVGFREPIRYLQTDGLGSVTSLVAESFGFQRALNPTERITYDTFGSPHVVSAGPDTFLDTSDDLTLTASDLGNPFLFTGREWDAETGLYYYRARYYDPRTGTFLQEDPASGSVVDPPSLHRYGYARQNPLLFVDPSGRVTLAAVIITGAIAALAAGLGAKLANGSPTQIAVAAGIGGLAGLGGALLGATSVAGAMATAGLTSGSSNVATNYFNQKPQNLTSLAVSISFGMLGAAAAFPLAAGAASSVTGALAAGLAAELPINLLGIAIEHELPPITFESIEQEHFFEQDRKTCFLNRA